MSQGFTRGGRPVDWGAVTTLPTTGVSVGDTCTYKADVTNQYWWQLLYDGVGSYPWKYIGGQPMMKFVDAQQNVVNAGFVDPATAGPSLTNPLAGVYSLRIEATIQATGANALYASPIVGGVGPTLTDAIFVYSSNAAVVTEASVGRTLEKTLAVSTVIKLMYGTGNGYVQHRGMMLTPIQVG